MSPVMAIVLASAFAAGSREEPATPATNAAGAVPQIRFEKYTLPNGLQVILYEDHSTPIVGVNVWYHVGSKNERPGRTGFAHLFEHMMFQGSKHWDRDYFAPLLKAGGRLNGSTNQDRTNYWETVPANYLELALWMESDRMGFLLPAMSQEKLDKQRDVVKNERRQSYENRPYGLAHEVILAAGYPSDHPYSWPTIGSMTDLDKASREDIADFFRRYYHPGNASFCVAGDFDPAVAKRLVEKYFGPIPCGPKVEKLPVWNGELKEAKRIHMTDRVGLSRLYMVWHSVPAFAADDAELEILADVLAGGKTSRLYRRLVREKQIAQEVQAFQGSDEIAGGFMIVATARPGHTPAELEGVILAELKRIQSAPPSADEVARAVNRFEVAFHPAVGSGGRLWRQGRSTQHVQHLHRRPRLLEQGLPAVPSGRLRRGPPRGREIPDTQRRGLGGGSGQGDRDRVRSASKGGASSRATGQRDPRGGGAGACRAQGGRRPQDASRACADPSFQPAAYPSRQALQRPGSPDCRESRAARGQHPPAGSRRSLGRPGRQDRPGRPDFGRLGRRDHKPQLRADRR